MKSRILFAAILLLGTATVAEAQEDSRCIVCKPSVAVDVGLLQSPEIGTMVAELYLGAETAIPHITPYVFLSWTPLMKVDAAKPSVITQVAIPLIERGGFTTSLDVGAAWYPSNSYKPVATVNPYAAYKLPSTRNFLFISYSTQPLREWTWEMTTGIGYQIR